MSMILLKFLERKQKKSNQKSPKALHAISVETSTFSHHLNFITNLVNKDGKNRKKESMRMTEENFLTPLDYLLSFKKEVLILNNTMIKLNKCILKDHF